MASDQLGVASATKMCRSVMIKGLEAMVIESFTTARAYGVEDAVVASLAETFPGIDWERKATYFFQRVDRAWPAARRGGARGGRDRPRGRAGALVGGGHRRAPGLGGRPGRCRRVRREGRRASLAARTGEPRPTASSTREQSKTIRGDDDIREDARLARLVCRPDQAAVQGAARRVDAHCHVFGPGAEFPYAPERKYTPCDASQGRSSSRCATTWALPAT